MFIRFVAAAVRFRFRFYEAGCLSTSFRTGGTNRAARSFFRPLCRAETGFPVSQHIIDDLFFIFLFVFVFLLLSPSTEFVSLLKYRDARRNFGPGSHQLCLFGRKENGNWDKMKKKTKTIKEEKEKREVREVFVRKNASTVALGRASEFLYRDI